MRHSFPIWSSLVFVAIGGLAPSVYADPWFAFSEANQHLLCAHRQFARENYRAMLLCLKEALEGPIDESSKEDALELLDEAFARGGDIDFGWKLPPQITALEIAQRRLQWADGKVEYYVRVAGNGNYRRLDQVQVIQYPNKVIIDKVANVGGWYEVDPNRKDKEYRFAYSSIDFPKPIPDGLFYLKLRIDGKSTDGWFIFSHMGCASSPKIVPSGTMLTFNTASPTIRWKDFESERYRDFEDRAVIAALSPRDQQDPQLTRWFLKQPIHGKKLAAAPRQAQVGRDGILTGGHELEKGLYFLAVAYDEMRHVGRLTLAASAMTIVPIVIKDP